MGEFGDRYGGEKSKIAGYRAALADVQPLTNRRTKFVVLAFESSGWTNPTVSAEAGQRVGAAGFADVWAPTGVVGRPAPDTTRAVQRDPILELGLPPSCGPSPRINTYTSMYLLTASLHYHRYCNIAKPVESRGTFIEPGH